MKKLVFFFLLFVSLLSFGQPDTTTRIKNQTVSIDSLANKTNELNERIANERKNRQEEMDALNQRNLEYMVQLQKERNAKQKRNAIIRIVIGVGLLVVLVIGLRRKRKK